MPDITPTGSPDFGQNQSTNPTAPSYDSAEDTTRLLMGGGAQARSGRWIYATGFEDGNLSSIIQGSVFGFTGSETLDSVVSFQGAASLKMATLAVLNSSSFFAKKVLPPGSRFGFEFMFRRTLTTPDFQHELRIQIAYSGNQGLGLSSVWAEIRIVFVSSANVKIYYINSGAGTTLLKDVSGYFVNIADNWHYIKFIVDAKTGKYARMYFDDLFLDMSTLGAFVQAGSYPLLTFSIQLLTSTANQQIYHIDNLILTADEP